jgi:hypothetical protein
MKNTTTTMTINVSTQQVGIGTITPLTPLHVQAAIPLAEPYAHILVEGTAATPNAALAFSNATGWARMGVAGGTNQYATGSLIGDLVLTTQTTNKKMMFVNQSGTGMTLSNNSVGIGCNNPQVSLDVIGKTRILANGCNNPNQYGITRDSLIIQTTDNSFGSNPASILFTTSQTNYPFARIIGINSGTSGGIFKGDLVFQSQYNAALNEGMRLTTDGRVGIGISSPVYELDVVGSSRVTTQQFIGFSNSNTGTLRLVAAGGTNFIQSGSNNTSGSGNTLTFCSINNITQTMTINTSTQRVGIGTTSPTFPLDVAGTIRGSGNIVRTISRRLGTGAGSVSFSPGSNTVLSLSYTPVQSGNVSTLVICSPSYNFLAGTGFDRFLLYMICPNSADNDSLYMGQNGNVIEGSRGVAPIIHSFQILAGQNGAGTYRLAIDSGGGLSDDSVFFNNQTTITIMELSQT